MNHAGWWAHLPKWCSSASRDFGLHSILLTTRDMRDTNTHPTWSVNNASHMGNSNSAFRHSFNEKSIMMQWYFQLQCVLCIFRVMKLWKEYYKCRKELLAHELVKPVKLGYLLRAFCETAFYLLLRQLWIPIEWFISVWRQFNIKRFTSTFNNVGQSPYTNLIETKTYWRLLSPWNNREEIVYFAVILQWKALD
jgi:hypothetical protein